MWVGVSGHLACCYRAGREESLSIILTWSGAYHLCSTPQSWSMLGTFLTLRKRRFREGRRRHKCHTQEDQWGPERTILRKHTQQGSSPVCLSDSCVDKTCVLDPTGTVNMVGQNRRRRPRESGPVKRQGWKLVVVVNPCSLALEKRRPPFYYTASLRLAWTI